MKFRKSLLALFIAIVLSFFGTSSDAVAAPSGNASCKLRSLSAKEIEAIAVLTVAPPSQRVVVAANIMYMLQSPAIDSSLREGFDAMANLFYEQRTGQIRAKLEKRLKKSLGDALFGTLASGNQMSFRRQIAGRFGISRSDAFGADVGFLLLAACMDQSCSPKEKEFIVYRMLKHIFLASRSVATDLYTSADGALEVFVANDSLFVGDEFVCRASRLTDQQAAIPLTKALMTARNSHAETFDSLYSEFRKLVESDKADSLPRNPTTTNDKGLRAMIRLDSMTSVAVVPSIENALRASGCMSITITAFDMVPESMKYVIPVGVHYSTGLAEAPEATYSPCQNCLTSVAVRLYREYLVATCGTKPICVVSISNIWQPENENERNIAFGEWKEALESARSSAGGMIAVGEKNTLIDLFLLVKHMARYKCVSIVGETICPLSNSVLDRLIASPTVKPFRRKDAQAR